MPIMSDRATVGGVADTMTDSIPTVPEEAAAFHAARFMKQAEQAAAAGSANPAQVYATLALAAELRATRLELVAVFERLIEQ